jgi:hypothetical protein
MAARKTNGKKKNEEKALTVASEYAVLEHTVEDLQNIIAANLGNSNLGPGDLDKIKVPAGGGTTWELITLDGEVETKEFDGVIAGWKEQRAYWEEKYSGGSSPPDCSSDNGIVGVGNPGGDCSECPYAQFESAKNDKGEPAPGQACKQVRVMAIVQKDDLVPVLLVAPPTSLQNMKKYFLRLASRATPYYGVLTRFTLVKDKNAGGIEYSKIEAKSIGRLDDDQMKKMTAYSKMISSSLERRSAAHTEDYEE